MEVIETDMLVDKSFEKNKLICDGRLKASFVVDNKFVIEIEDNAMINFKKNNQLSHMARARLADKLVKENGFEGYIGISLLEMEYHKNEAEYLLNVLRPMSE